MLAMETVVSGLEWLCVSDMMLYVMWYGCQTARSDLAYMRMSRRLPEYYRTKEWIWRKDRKIMKLKGT